MASFQVIGRDGRVTHYSTDGDVMGDVMGKRRKKGGAMVKVQKADWRNRQLAPGVQLPDEGLLTLPMRSQNSGLFNLANQTQIFEGRLQKPFRGERILLDVVRTGASAVGRLLCLMWVGTDLQQVDITRVDLEQLGQAAAFGVRLTMSPAQPGVTIAFDVILSSALAGTDTIFTTLQLLGRVEH